MSQSMILNPLTMAELAGEVGNQTLTLRSFAPGRSLIPTIIGQSEDLVLFSILLDWVSHNRIELPPLSRSQHLQFWSNGLLISEAERATMPRAARPSFDASAIAAMLCPEVGSLLTQAFVPRLPAGTAKEDLALCGICELSCLFQQNELMAILGYYRQLQAGNWLKPDRHQTTQKIVRNDPVARHIQTGVTATVSKLAGEAVKPSFSYATEYHSEAALPRHTDREQCEFTLSIYVDYGPSEDASSCPWPLVVHAIDSDNEFHPERGGGVLLKGRELEHSRPPLPSGHRALQFMLCFVPEGFAGPLI